ncbi:MAG: recombinase family protein, partial [Anaerococcus sp.]|nr:recombinase family protein [Anaerococcus sp.]
GVKDSQNSNSFKEKRKNAEDNDINKFCSYKNDEDKKLCSQAKDNACGSYSLTHKGKLISRKVQFYDQKLY